MKLLKLPTCCDSEDENLHIVQNSKNKGSILSHFLSKLRVLSTSLVQHRVSSLVCNRYGRIFVVRGNAIYIYASDLKCWLTPPLSCAIVDHICCISMMPYTDTILVGTNDGLYVA